LRDDVIAVALQHEAQTIRELAMKFIDEKGHFISEPSTYPLPGRILRSNARDRNMRAENETDRFKLAFKAPACD
jgi:hypothetical protein